MEFKPLFPDFCKKAVTFGFDDGEDYDRDVAAILRQNGLAGTFFLISDQFGLCVPDFKRYGKVTTVRRVSAEEIPDTYRGMEVASHSAAHKLPHDALDAALGASLDRLSRLCGYKVRGLAYPGGHYDERLTALLRSYPVEYARTVKFTYGFGLPDDFLEWHPTCHFACEEIEALTTRFETENPEGLSLFYIMGHSYELTKNEGGYSFGAFEKLCSRLSAMEKVWKEDNIGIALYIKAVRSLVIGDGFIENPSDIEIYGIWGGTRVTVPAKSRLK